MDRMRGRMLVIGRVRPPQYEPEVAGYGASVSTSSSRGEGGGQQVLQLVYNSRSFRASRGSAAASPPPSQASDVVQLEFPFTTVLGPESAQEEVFASVRGTLESALASGHNAVVFAYGQTGSGKTFTMLGGGTFKTRGLMQRVLGMVFAHVDRDKEGGGELGVSLSMAEVYCEAVYDILRHLPPGASEVAASKDPTNVGARLAALAATSAGRLSPLEQWPKVDMMEGEDGSLQCRGLKTWEVGSEAAALGLLLAGHLARTTSSTPLNAASSRSHAVLTLTVSGPGRPTSRIHMVDLAGSERVHKTSDMVGAKRGGGGGQGSASAAAAAVREKEGAQINLSLHCLELVMLALAERQGNSAKGAGGGGSGSRRGSRTSLSSSSYSASIAAFGSSGSSSSSNPHRPRASSVPVRRPSNSNASVASAGEGSITGSLRSLMLGGGVSRAGSIAGGSSSSSSSSSSTNGGRVSPAPVHIPYRNSALTSLLRDALGSYCWPVLVACVAPEAEHGEESTSTCRFAARCALMDATTVPVESQHHLGGGWVVRGGARGGGGGTLSSGGGGELIKQLAAAQERIRELQALAELHSAHAEELTLRVAELESSSGGGGSGSGSVGVEEATLSHTTPSDTADVEASIFAFLQQPPSLGGATQRQVTLSVPVLSSKGEGGRGGEGAESNPYSSVGGGGAGYMGGESVSLPRNFSAWGTSQLRYAFLLLREAVGAAVTVAGTSAAEADEMKTRAENAEEDAAALRASILSLQIRASQA